VPPIPLRAHPPRVGLAELTRFAVVGSAGFIVDVGGFNLLRAVDGTGPLYEYPLTAKVISSVLGIVVAWLGNRYWTYAQQRRAKAHHEFFHFLVVCAVGIGISLLCLWISHYALAHTSLLADNLATNVIGFGLATAFRFWAYRTHVFNDFRSDGTGERGESAETPDAVNAR